MDTFVSKLSDMESVIYKPYSFRRLSCRLFGHRFVTTRLVTGHIREFECSCCHLQVTNDLHGHKISLTQEHRDINETLVNLYQRRHLHA